MMQTKSAHGQIKSFLDRILRLKEEQDALGADIKEVYAEAKSNGFDKTVLGLAVARLRKEVKQGAVEVEEKDSLLALYLDAYRGASGSVASEYPANEKRAVAPLQSAANGHSEAPSHAREGNGGISAPAHDPVTGEISEPDSAPSTVPEVPPPGDLRSPALAADQAGEVPHASPVPSEDFDMGGIPAFMDRRGGGPVGRVFP